MTIKEIKAQLEQSSHPVAKALHKGEHFRVLVIGFKKGMVLREHQAHMPSKLTVLSGHVVYGEKEKIIDLMEFDEIDIPINVAHFVEAKEDSLCILTQG